MKQLVCEMCGGTDLVKDGGVFVCQTCGCKYSIEEARKMMVEGTVEVAGTVKIDNSAQIQNFLDLSKNAYESGNGQSAFDYANKALEIAPQNSRAWIAKMKAIEYMGTFGDLKMMEVIEAGKNAVTYAPEDQKKEITLEVYTYELTRALSLLKLAMTKMRDTEDVKSTFKRFALISVLTAGKNTLQVDSKVVNLYDNVANEAMATVLLVPDEVMADFSSLAKLAGECAKQYQYETDALIERYKIYGATLLDSALKTRNEKKKSVEEKAKRAEALAIEKEEKERAERIEAYWNDHSDEKADLDAKKSAADAAIKALSDEMDQIPELSQKKEFDAKIASLEQQMSSLGLFKGKEKKALQSEIDTIRADLKPVEAVITEKRKAIQAKIDEQAKIIKDVEAELNKDR